MKPCSTISKSKKYFWLLMIFPNGEQISNQKEHLATAPARCVPFANMDYAQVMILRVEQVEILKK